MSAAVQLVRVRMSCARERADALRELLGGARQCRRRPESLVRDRVHHGQNVLHPVIEFMRQQGALIDGVAKLLFSPALQLDVD